MATEAENLSAVAPSANTNDDSKYGFEREEMYKTALKGTVDAYDRHVFLAYKGPEAWPAKVESSKEDTLPKLFASAMKARKNDITVKVCLLLKRWWLRLRLLCCLSMFDLLNDLILVVFW